MSIQHTDYYANASVIVNQHIDSSHQLVHQCISYRKPTCQFNIPTNTLTHQSVNVNQHVDWTHKSIRQCISEYQPACQSNTSVNHVNQPSQSTNMLINQHVNQPTRQCISEYQPTCESNSPTNKSVEHISLYTNSIVNVNQLVYSTHQLICYCDSLHYTSIQHNQRAKVSAARWVRWIQVLNLRYCE